MEPQNIQQTQQFGASTQQVQQVQTPPAPLPPSSSPGGRRKIVFVLGFITLLIAGFLVFQFLLPRFTQPREISLIWWGLWEDENIIKPLISEYESSHPGVTIQYVKQSPKDYRERLASALVSGNGPDVFRFHNSWVPMFKNNLDMIPANIYTPSEFAQVFFPVASTDLSTINGIVGIPLEYDALTLFVNTDIFTQAGKTTPKTWDDVRERAFELTIKDERGVITQSGIAMGTTENIDHWPEILANLMLQNGASLTAPRGVLAEKALEYYVQYYKLDKVWDTTLPMSTEAFAAGKLAMYFGPSWRAHEFQIANPNLKFKTVPMPQVPKDSESDPNLAYATYWVEGVNKNSKNKAESWEFLKFMSSKESLEKFYQTASQIRGFGEPYSRVEMASLLEDHPIVGSVISLAPEATSWYLASQTHDGPTGINSQIANYYKDAVNAVGEGAQSKNVLETVTAGVAQVLGQYQSSSR